MQRGTILAKTIDRLMALDDASVLALSDIAEERLRQVEAEGWTLEHDDGHAKGEMARAAGCYALEGWTAASLLNFWPWSEGWWKPKSLHRNQVRAGALLVAELARHLRSAPH